MAFNKRAAAARLALRAFTPANRRFLDYWLSCHTADGLLCESNFAPADVAEITRATVSADMKLGVSAVVTQVGASIAEILSYDLLGADLIEMLPGHLRPLRLERMAEIAKGAIAHNLQRVITHLREFEWEEVIVPFGPRQADGTYRIVTHIDVEAFAALHRAIEERSIRPAETFRLIPLEAYELKAA